MLGGGLLGIEASGIFASKGVPTTIVHRSTFLMPHQLNAAAARTLEEKLNILGIDTLLGRETTSIIREEGRIKLTFSDGYTLITDAVAIAIGITPNSELAESCALNVGIGGGVIVDRKLRTSDPAIFAIGECARLNGQIYGLAAPGYTMAKALAQRLAGEKSPLLKELDRSTRLKLLGADVITIGNPLEDGIQFEFQDSHRYRILVLNRQHRIVGALGVGPWKQASLIQTLYLEQVKIPKRELIDFNSKGLLTRDDPLSTSVTQWPNNQLVCNCSKVTKGEILDSAQACSRNPDKVCQQTGAGTICGSCRPMVDSLCGHTTTASTPLTQSKPLFGLSVVALTITSIAILAPSPPMASSVESLWHKVDQLWRDPVIKQITGFTMVGLFLFGLTLSLRKRIASFKWGKFINWRYVHVGFGILSLIVLFAHTGFRFGHNLNFWLMLTFVCLNLLGALTGVAASLENHSRLRLALLARRLRPHLAYIHTILFWPLPVLIAFHIASAYVY